jgi:hypothetical protein
MLSHAARLSIAVPALQERVQGVHRRHGNWRGVRCPQGPERRVPRRYAHPPGFRPRRRPSADTAGAGGCGSRCPRSPTSAHQSYRHLPPTLCCVDPKVRGMPRARVATPQSQARPLTAGPWCGACPAWTNSSPLSAEESRGSKSNRSSCRRQLTRATPQERATGY